MKSDKDINTLAIQYIVTGDLVAEEVDSGLADDDSEDGKHRNAAVLQL